MKGGRRGRIRGREGGKVRQEEGGRRPAVAAGVLIHKLGVVN